ncbi:MAG: MobA/MobL family protein [Ruminococcus sp.]|nr:MobA/MobL family protein [Ruminococcus sp.]
MGINHRSYAAQGILKIPQKHLGAATCAIEKKGYRTDKGSYNRKVILENTNLEIKKSW